MLETFLNILSGFAKTKDAVRLKSLSVDNLRQACDQINLLNSETTKYYEIAKQNREKSQAMKVLTNSPEDRQTFIRLSRQLFNAIQIKQARTWYVQQCHKFLYDPNWWSYAANVSDRFLEVGEIQNAWKQHGRYAIFSTPDLIGIYWRQLSVIGDWLNLFQQEFKSKQKQLPIQFAKQCQVALKQLTDELQQSKIAIRASLLARLEIGVKNGDLCFDDLVVDTTQALMKLGAVPSTTLPNGNYRHMTPSTLYYIRQIIGIDGSKGEKKRLSRILVPSASSALSILSAPLVCVKTVIRQNEYGIAFVIPDQFQSLVDAKPPFYTRLPKGLQFLFRGEKALYEFFQENSCQYLWVAQNHLIQHEVESDISLSHLRHSDSFAYYQMLTDLLEREAKRCAKKIADFSPILYPDVHQLLRGYHRSLKQLAKHVFIKQENLFACLLSNVEKQIQVQNVFQSCGLIESEKFTLDDMVDQLSNFQKKWQIPATASWRKLYDRYQAIMKLSSRFPVTEPMVNQATQVVQKVCDGQVIRPAEQIVLSEVNERITFHSPIKSYSQANFYFQQRTTPSKLWKSLQIAFQQSSLTLTAESLVSHLQVIKQQVEMLTVLQPTFVSSSEWQNTLYTYACSLLAEIQDLSGRSAFTRLEGHVEFVLRTLLDINHKQDEALHHTLTQLQQNIQQLKALDWDLFCQIAIAPACNALTQSLSTSVPTFSCKR